MRATFYTAILILGISVAAFSQTIIREETVSTLKPKPAATRTVTEKPNQTQASPYVRPDAKKRFNRYVNGTIGPLALVRYTAGAGFSTWTNSPEAWGDKWEGFGRRVASNFGRGVIQETTTYTLDEALKVDSYFYRSKKRDLNSKLSNALLSTVTARNKNGKRVFGAPRIAGAYASNIIAAEAWYPSNYDYKDGLTNGTISLGINAAFNVFREFVRIKK